MASYDEAFGSQLVAPCNLLRRPGAVWRLGVHLLMGRSSVRVPKASSLPYGSGALVTAHDNSSSIKPKLLPSPIAPLPPHLGVRRRGLSPAL